MTALPNHPILVHFPIAFGIMLPIFSLVILIGCHKAWFSKLTWILVPMLLATIVGTGWLAMEAGEKDEDIVEKVVGEEVVDAHHHLAEFFWRGAIGLFVLSLVPFGVSKGRTVTQATVVVGSLGLLWPLVNAGHSGGELVYRMGAASAHVEKYKAEAVPATGNGAAVPMPDRDSDSEE